MKGFLQIRSFNGIGDLLFITPSLQRLKEANGSFHITVNTHYPELLKGNPYVDHIGHRHEGLFCGYPDPHYGIHPTKHHILSDWEIIAKYAGVTAPPPVLKPQLFLDLPRQRSSAILVQVQHKGQWGGKKIWPHFETLAAVVHGSPIPHCQSVTELVHTCAQAALVICAEGAISHIARAVDTPAIVIFGGWAKPMWNGYSEQCNLITAPLCSPCYNRFPCRNRKKCFDPITVDVVYGFVQRFLLEGPDAIVGIHSVL